MKRKLTALLALTVLVSCGDPLKEVGNAVLDTTNTAFKALDDTVDTTSKTVRDVGNTSNKALYDVGQTSNKAISDVNESAKESLTDSRVILEDGSYGLVYSTGKTIESIGQVPREIGNSLLGIDADSDEKIDDLENETKDLQSQIDELREEMIQEFSNMNDELNSVAQELRNEDSNLYDTIQNLHTTVTDELNSALSNYATVSQLNRANSRIRQLRRFISRVNRNMHNLSVICDSDLVYNWFSVDVETYCRISSNRPS